MEDLYTTSSGIPIYRGIVNFDGSLTESMAVEILQSPTLNTIQTTEIVDKEVWKVINDIVLVAKPEVKVRLYGNEDSYDLSFLKELSNCTCLSIGHVRNVSNIESIKSLIKLKKLILDIYQIQSFCFLAEIGCQLTSLIIGRPKSKKPNLQFLEQCTNLEYLNISGVSKNIDKASELQHLRELSISGMKLEDFSFLYHLPNLTTLNLGLITSNKLEDLSCLKLKSLAVSEIRNLADLSFIGGFTNLQKLTLSDLNKVIAMPKLKSKESLRRIFIDNMKTLENIRALYDCINLEQIIFRVDSTKLQPEDFYPFSQLNSLSDFTIGLGSYRKNDLVDNYFASKNKYPNDAYEFKIC
jgi:hypothetical protein